MQYFKRLPVIARVMIYLALCELLVMVSQILTGFTPWRAQRLETFLLVPLVLLLTAGILRMESGTWSDIGQGMAWEKLRQLFIGVLVGLTMLAATAVITSRVIGFHWVWHPYVSWRQLIVPVLSSILSSWLQEVVFRGYPFFLLLRRYGPLRTQLLIGLLFGCMHLSEGISWQEALLIMVNTGLGSVLFGIATIRTRAIYLAAGIHTGWNLLQLLVPRAPGQAGPLMTATPVNTPIIPLQLILPYWIIAAAACFVVAKIGDSFTHRRSSFQ